MAAVKTARSTGDDGDRQSMISRRYGVREVRHSPGSPEATDESMRWRSAQADTVNKGSGLIPWRKAWP